MKDWLGIQRKDPGPSVSWCLCKKEMKLTLLGDLPRTTWHILSQSVTPSGARTMGGPEQHQQIGNCYVLLMMMMKIILGTLGI